MSMASMKGIEKGSGALINMMFTINQNAIIGTEMPINLTDVSVFDEIANLIAISIQNGKIKIISECVKGDINADGAIKSSDVILALRISAGITTPSQQQICAADMNGDGIVRSNNAILILRKSVGLGSPSRIIQEFKYTKNCISINEVYGEIGKIINVPISINNKDIIAGGDIVVKYDNSILKAVEVLPDKNSIMESSIDANGIINIAFAGINFSSGSKIADLKFEVLRDRTTELAIVNAELFDTNAFLVDTVCDNGRFKPYSMPADKTLLLQNYPNPFNPETWIPYQLNEDADVVIRIFSSSGSLIRTLDLGYKPSGFYEGKERSAYWDGSNEFGEKSTSGVYFYTIQAGIFTATKKMVIQK